jgi:outer membrane receptor protein involved in Fe transport
MLSPRTFVPALLATLAACATLPGAAPDADDGFRPGGAHVVVLEDEQLQRAPGSLLQALAGRVAQLRVKAGSTCPNIEIRGVNSVQGSSDPVIYLDGTMAGNTCLLEQLRSAEVRRVEVYPMGVTARAGYRNSAGGLILVFSRDARH